MRRWVAMGAVAATVIAAPLVVRAATGTGSGALDSQSYAWRDSSIVTTSTLWTNVPSLSVTVCARNAITATVSVGAIGAAMGMRVMIDSGPASMRPGETHLDDAGGTTSFSFTFTDNVSPIGGSDSHVVNVQWRSPTGFSTTMVRGALSVLYEKGLSGPGC